MIELANTTLPPDHLREMIASLQEIRREAEHRGAVKLIELTDQCAELAGRACRRQTIWRCPINSQASTWP